MKFPVFISFLLLSLYSFGQKQSFRNLDQETFFRIGAKAGVNINKIQGHSYKEGYNYNYLLGGFMQFNFSNRFGLQPEVNFSQSSSEFSKDAADIYDDIFRDGTQKTAKLNYLKIPVLLNINVGESKHVKFQIGPQFGSVLKETVDSLKANRNIFKKADWAAIGGLWLQLPFINMGGRYELGLTNINAIDNRENWKNQGFTFFIGFTF